MRDFNVYSLGRDPKCLDGKVRLQTEILAYTGQQLIPDPLADIGLKLYPQGLRRFLTMSMDLGSVIISGQWILDKPGREELLVIEL